MYKGVSVTLCLSRSVLSVLFINLCLAAPGPSETHREEDSITAVTHPFQSKEDSRRLLRSYIDSILNTEGQRNPEINSWEQEVFFVFRLHDYDRSGFLDGLEMIKLLYDFNAFHSPGVVYSNNEVASVVDFLLQTQDLNHDGLFSPSELLTPPLLTQHEETVQDTIKGAQNEVEVQMETQPQQEERTEEDSPLASVDEQNTPQEAQNNPLTGDVENVAPVHQGQPEI